MPNHALTDLHGRTKRKLRVSLTDRCNLRCQYCMPEHPEWRPTDKQLSTPELIALITQFVDMGITAIRLTGGEPLLRHDIVDITAALNALRTRGLQRISLTTNGILLPKYLDDLLAAGLDDVNISLDSVDPEQFSALTKGKLAPVLRGIEHASHSKLQGKLPIKLNAVIIRGYNDDQLLPLARFASEHRITLRFIEFMPLDANGDWSKDKVVSEQEILATLGTAWAIEPLATNNDPANGYHLSSGASRLQLGIIPTVSNPFCSSCDRLRITAEGELYTCLFADRGHELAPLGGDLREQAIRTAVMNKQAGFAVRPHYAEREITMHHLGG